MKENKRLTSVERCPYPPAPEVGEGPGNPVERSGGGGLQGGEGRSERAEEARLPEVGESRGVLSVRRGKQEDMKSLVDRLGCELNAKGKNNLSKFKYFDTDNDGYRLAHTD